MRDELKASIWVVSPKKIKDSLNHVHISGYENLRTYEALVVSGNESESIERYGLLPTNRLQILFMDESVQEQISQEDGLYLTEPTAGDGGLYSDPEFLVDNIHQFRHIRIYTAVKTV